MSGAPRIGDLERTLAGEFPLEWAEEWDRVGLAAGDPNREIEGVLVTLDPTIDAIARAADRGANVLVTHHPAALESPQVISPTGGPAGALFAALDGRVALIAAHTNLDRSPRGVRALPDALGLVPLEPLERSLQPMTKVTVYAPEDAAPGIIGAMSLAGAGRIGEYEGASFLSLGEGRFTPLPGASPAIGSPGVPETVREARIEMVCPPSRTSGVIAAARSVHPYEEPLITSEAASIARGSACLGMRCSSDIPLTLGGLAARAASRFRSRPRVWGPSPETAVANIVTATGSLGSLLRDVVASGADALVCGEVRYHDALDAVASGLSIIELGHDVSEWPLVEVLAASVRATPGLDSTMVFEDPPAAGWWTPDGR